MRSAKSLWYIGLGVLMIFATVLYVNNNYGGWSEGDSIFYYASTATIALTYILIPFSLVLVIRNLIANAKYREPFRKSIGYWLALLLFLLAGLIGDLASLVILFHPYTQMDRIFVSDHIYQIGSTFAITVGGGGESSLILWECDRIDWYCRILFTEDYYSDMSPRLTYDAKSSSLLLKINNGTDFSFQIYSN